MAEAVRRHGVAMKDAMDSAQKSYGASAARCRKMLNKIYLDDVGSVQKSGPLWCPLPERGPDLTVPVNVPEVGATIPMANCDLQWTELRTQDRLLELLRNVT